MNSSLQHLEHSRRRSHSPPCRASGAPAIHVVVAHDRALVREGLRQLLNLRGGIVVIDEIDQLSRLSDAHARDHCDVLLLGTGLCVRELADVRRLTALTKVLLVCDSDEAGDVVGAMRAGALGAVLDRGSVDALCDAIAAVASGQPWMPPEVQSHMMGRASDDPPPRLTRREREVLRHVALGRRNAEVAELLLITEQTVKTHLGHIFHKTGARDRVALAIYAARNGIITLP